MPKFKSRPRIIEAEQFFKDKPLPFADRKGVKQDNYGYFVVTAREQKVYLIDGDWVTPEPDGKHFYPIKDDIIKQNYEPAD